MGFLPRIFFFHQPCHIINLPPSQIGLFWHQDHNGQLLCTHIREAHYALPLQIYIIAKSQLFSTKSHKAWNLILNNLVHALNSDQEPEIFGTLTWVPWPNKMKNDKKEMMKQNFWCSRTQGLWNYGTCPNHWWVAWTTPDLPLTPDHSPWPLICAPDPSDPERGWVKNISWCNKCTK